MTARNLLAILSQRTWQGFAGLVTVIFVARFLTPAEQGWFYTFVSIAALYSVFEMGLSTALVQTSAHLFPGLRWDLNGKVSGPDAAVFASFVSQAVRTYFWLAAGFSVLVMLIGAGYFSEKAVSAGLSGIWLYPWFGLVSATACAMVVLPFLSVVEGSGELFEVYGVRLVQGVVGSLVCWMLLAAGEGLWASVAMPAMGFVVALLWLSTYRRRTMGIVMMPIEKKNFNWRIEVWPLQWRIGVSWVGVYMMSQMATPILFYFQNPEMAGQIGLSLTVAHMIGIIAQSALVRTIPAMSLLVVQRDWIMLKQVFRKGFSSFCMIFFALTALVVIAYQWVIHTDYAERILPPVQFAGLMVFVFFYQMNGAYATQLRSFRSDPLAWVFSLGGLFTVTGSLLVAGSHAAYGVILVMVLVQVVFVFPLSLLIRRRRLDSWCRE